MITSTSIAPASSAHPTSRALTKPFVHYHKSWAFPSGHRMIYLVPSGHQPHLRVFLQGIHRIPPGNHYERPVFLQGTSVIVSLVPLRHPMYLFPRGSIMHQFQGTRWYSRYAFKAPDGTVYSLRAFYGSSCSYKAPNASVYSLRASLVVVIPSAAPHG